MRIIDKLQENLVAEFAAFFEGSWVF